MIPAQWGAWAKAFPLRAEADAPYVSPFKVILAAGKPPDILLYGPIGKDWMSDEGIVAKEFAEILAELPKGQRPRLRINSPGGNFFEGTSIYNLSLEHGVDVRIDGVAASIAAIIACAGGTVEMPESSRMMIHKAWGLFIGNSDDVESFKDTLDTCDEAQFGIIALKTGKSKDAIKGEMAKDRWFTAKEAVDFGLADKIAKESPKAAIEFPIAASAEPISAPSGAANKPTKELTMNRTEMIAALKARGVTVADNATDEWLKAELAKPTPAPAAATEDPRMKKLEERMARQRASDISRELDQLVLDNRITAQEAKEWLPKCIAEHEDTKPEETILATLKKREPILPGAAPVKALGVSGGKTAIDLIKEKKEGKERRDFLMAEWGNLLLAGVPLVATPNRGYPQAANTMDTTALTTDMLASSFIVVLQNRLPLLSAFSRNFGTDRIKPLAEIQVPIVTAGGTAQTNATNFEDTTNFVGTVDNRPVQPARLTSGAHLTAAELNQGFFMQQFAEIKAHELADAIQAAVNAIITVANFPGATAAAFSGFGQDELGALWELIAKSSIKNVMLHQSYYRNFLPASRDNWAVDQQPGWDGFFLNTYWTGAGTNVRGFACNPQAIAVGSGLPLASPNRGMIVNARTITLPGLGISVEQQEWFAAAGKVDWVNWELMFGAALGDASAGVAQPIA